jgi:hypothetical protein
MPAGKATADDGSINSSVFIPMRPIKVYLCAHAAFDAFQAPPGANLHHHNRLGLVVLKPFKMT